MELNIKKLHELATNLMFQMNEEEYESLLKEFEVIVSQMELLNQIAGIEDYPPLVHPLLYPTNGLREDEIGEVITTADLLLNAKDQLDQQIKLPKVVK